MHDMRDEDTIKGLGWYILRLNCYLAGEPGPTSILLVFELDVPMRAVAKWLVL